MQLGKANKYFSEFVSPRTCNGNEHIIRNSKKSVG